jgi:hypothetical protein
MLYQKRGQSTLEDALLIVAIVAAFTVISHYVNRATQGKLKESSDQIGKQFDSATSEGYKTAWRNKGDGTSTITTETRNTTSGDTTSTITQAEPVTRSEHDEFGATTQQHY